VLAAVKLIPRLLFNVMSAVANKVPPFSTSEATVAEPGAVPKLASAPIDKVPAVIVVIPVYVFVPESVVVPVVFCVNPNAAPLPSAITPVVKLVLLAPVMLSVAAEDVVGPVTFPVKVKPPEFALLSVLEASTLIARAELNAEEPVKVKVPPFKLITLLVLPRLAVVATYKVPAETVVEPE